MHIRRRSLYCYNFIEAQGQLKHSCQPFRLRRSKLFGPVFNFCKFIPLIFSFRFHFSLHLCYVLQHFFVTFTSTGNAVYHTEVRRKILVYFINEICKIGLYRQWRPKNASVFWEPAKLNLLNEDKKRNKIK